MTEKIQKIKNQIHNDLKTIDLNNYRKKHYDIVMAMNSMYTEFEGLRVMIK